MRCFKCEGIGHISRNSLQCTFPHTSIALTYPCPGLAYRYFYPDCKEAGMRCFKCGGIAHNFRNSP